MKSILFLFLFAISLNTFAQDSTSYKVLLTTGATVDIFSKPYDYMFKVHTVGAGYKGDKTSLILLYNRAFDISFATQYELDFYHKLTKSTSYWANYAYSSNAEFPQHRAMIRVWQNLGKGFLVSGGAKYYYFDDDLFTLTAGLEKYMGRYWVEGKTFFYLKEPKTKYAYQLNSRIFWKDVNYVQLSLTTGAAQDEPWISTEVLTAHTARLGVTSFINHKETIQLRANFGYSYEEYSEALWRNRYYAGVNFTFYIF